MFVFLNPNIPVPIVLLRRIPRTKSNFDRTSARRYSSVDSHCSYDNQQEPMTISYNNKQETYSNHLDLTNSTSRQYNDMIISSNGQDESTVSFGGDIDDDDSDEYAYFILHCFFFFSFSLPSLFILLVQYQQFFVLLGCFLFFLFIIY
jgi:hypothetical protein